MTFAGSVQLFRINNPTTTQTLDDGDDGAVLQFGIRYLFDNAGAFPDNPYAVDLPLQVAADKGKKLFLHTRYTNNPNDIDNFETGAIKRQGSDTLRYNGASQTEIELPVNDDNITLVADGAGLWTFE